MSGCIIPVAPDFQDPPGSPNYSPYWISATPGFGTVVTVPPVSIPPFEFTVVAADPNATDPLWVQWAIDYPPLAVGTTNATTPAKVPPTADGSPTMFSYGLNCNTLVVKTADSMHRLEVIVSDAEPSVPVNNMLPGVPRGRYAIQGDWTFFLACDGATTGP